MVDIGFAAGFYEGEGSVLKGNKEGVSILVSITQKDIEPLLKMRDLFGGNIKEYGGYHYWRLSGEKCHGFLLTIFTLLSARRRQQILKYKDFFLAEDRCPSGHPYIEGSYEMVQYKERNPTKSCLICRTTQYEAKKNGMSVKMQRLMDEAVKNFKKENGDVVT